MKHDTIAVPSPTGAIDWATEAHHLSIVDHIGDVVGDATIAHTTAGLGLMVDRFLSAGVQRVAIERPDGPVVDALIDAGLEVVVIHPRQLKNLRSRYGNAGNKDDALDAFVLADVLRTDTRRLVPL